MDAHDEKKNECQRAAQLRQSIDDKIASIEQHIIQLQQKDAAKDASHIESIKTEIASTKERLHELEDSLILLQAYFKNEKTKKTNDSDSSDSSY